MPVQPILGGMEGWATKFEHLEQYRKYRYDTRRKK